MAVCFGVRNTNSYPSSYPLAHWEKLMLKITTRVTSDQHKRLIQAIEELKPLEDLRFLLEAASHVDIVTHETLSSEVDS